MRLVLVLKLSLIEAASEGLLKGLVLSVVLLGGPNVGGAQMGVLELSIFFHSVNSPSFLIRITLGGLETIKTAFIKRDANTSVGMCQ